MKTTFTDPELNNWFQELPMPLKITAYGFVTTVLGVIENDIGQSNPALPIGDQELVDIGKSLNLTLDQLGEIFRFKKGDINE